MFELWQFRDHRQILIAEMGVDMKRFAARRHLCAWAGVAPASYDSAGERRAAGTRKNEVWNQRSSLRRRTPPRASRAVTSPVLQPVHSARASPRAEQGGCRGGECDAGGGLAFTHQWHAI